LLPFPLFLFVFGFIECPCVFLSALAQKARGAAARTAAGLGLVCVLPVGLHVLISDIWVGPKKSCAMHQLHQHAPPCPGSGPIPIPGAQRARFNRTFCVLCVYVLSGAAVNWSQIRDGFAVPEARGVEVAAVRAPLLYKPPPPPATTTTKTNQTKQNKKQPPVAAEGAAENSHRFFSASAPPGSNHPLGSIYNAVSVDPHSGQARPSIPAVQPASCTCSSFSSRPQLQSQRHIPPRQP
jgi:hypothetical protein